MVVVDVGMMDHRAAQALPFTDAVRLDARQRTGSRSAYIKSGDGRGSSGARGIEAEFD